MIKLILPEEKYWLSFQNVLQELKNYPTPYDIMDIKNALNFGSFADYKLDCENDRLGVGLKKRACSIYKIVVN